MAKKKSSKKDKKSKKSKKSKQQTPKVNFYCGTNCFSLPNGDEYVGDYCAHRNGLVWREGCGIYHTKDNQTYEGTWYADKLVDGTQITVTYNNGTVYKGTLLKNKYQGAGTYTLENGLIISGNFQNNKLIGDVKLIDFDGRLWHGIAKENEVILTPENIFYQNINDIRGKSKRILKAINPLAHIPSDMEVVDASPVIPLVSRCLKNRVFAKSTKTDAKIDFNNSNWHNKYLEYKQKRQYILNKFKNHERFTKEEYKWYSDWARCRKLAKARKYPIEIEKPVDTSLLQTFLGEEYEESCKPVKVYYPTYDWHIHLEEEEEYEEQEWKYEEDNVQITSNASWEESMENESIAEETEKVASEPKIEFNANVGTGTDSLCEFIKAISLNKDIRLR